MPSSPSSLLDVAVPTGADENAPQGESVVRNERRE
jgi:hypothetical protein